MRITIEEKRFGDKLIFSSVVFDIRKGMRTALLGPSGRGKTTLLRIAAGLDDDFIGRVDDRPEMPGILFQEDRLSERVSVLSNLMAVTDDRQKALEALGMGRLSAIRYSVWPQVLPSFLSTVLFCFEGNVRYASILGYVGAGGLGLILNEKIGWREYSRVGMILIALFVAVVVIETLSSWLRSKLT